MTSPPNPENLYCLPVMRSGDRFIEVDAEYERGFDLARFQEMQSFLERNYSILIHNVEIATRSFRVPIYVPRAEGYCYVVVGPDGIPLEPTDNVDRDWTWIHQYMNSLSEELAFSEGLARDQSCYIESEFLRPVLAHVDPESFVPKKTVQWEFALSHKRCVVLGDAGVGKTTLLRRLALELCKRPSDPSDPGQWPIYLKLREWNDAETAYHALVHAWTRAVRDDAPENSKTLWKSGRVTLFLDGLDEVPADARKDISTAIGRFADQEPMVGIVLATRTSAYRGEFRNFSHLLIRPFEDAHIYEWSYNRLYTEDRTVWRRFVGHLNELPKMKDVARNPFLLGLIVHFYRQNSIVPKDVSVLLESYVRAMVGEWDMVRGINRSRELWAAPNKKLSVISRLAFWLLDTGRSSFSTDEFCDSTTNSIERDTAKWLLPVIAEHTGFLMRMNAPNQWGFAHKTFLEFLAAHYLVERSDDISKVFAERLGGVEWSDVWAYACGLAQDASPLIKLLCEMPNISEVVKAQRLSQALSQNLNIDTDTLKSAGDIILAVLRKYAEAFSLENGSAIVDPSNGQWNLTVCSKDSLLPEGLEADDFASLLKELYRARSGVLIRYFNAISESIDNSIVAEFIKLFEMDGELSIVSNNSLGGLSILLQKLR